MFRAKYLSVLSLALATPQASNVQSRSGPPICDLNGEKYLSTGSAQAGLSNFEFITAVKASEENDVFTVTQDYYIGVPSGKVPVRDGGICFLFFHPNDDLRSENNGKCVVLNNLFNNECAEELLPDLDSWHFNGSAAVADCEAWGRKIQDNPPKACKLGKGWGSVTTRTISSNDTLDYITSSTNSGECWPTDDKNQLLLLGSFSRIAPNQPVAIDHLIAGTPIITNYYLDDARYLVNDEPERLPTITSESAICLAADYRPTSLGNTSDNTEGGPESGTGPNSMNLVPTLGFVLLMFSFTRGWM